MLEYVALFFIFLLIIVAAAVIVFVGSLPGKIARKRGHPWPDAVNAASWIGLATGVFWPVAFIWAFLPLPSDGTSKPTKDNATSNELANLKAKLTTLEETVARLQSRSEEDVS